MPEQNIIYELITMWKGFRFFHGFWSGIFQIKVTIYFAAKPKTNLNKDLHIFEPDDDQQN